MLRLALAISVSLAPFAAHAVSEQELNSLRMGLREYQIKLTNEELAQLSLSQRAELHFLLTSNEDMRTGDWLRTRQRIRFILSKDES